MRRESGTRVVARIVRAYRSRVSFARIVRAYRPRKPPKTPDYSRSRVLAPTLALALALALALPFFARVRAFAKLGIV